MSIGGAALIMAIAMLYMTSPRQAGPFGVLAFFILLYIVAAAISYLVLVTITKLFATRGPAGRWRLAAERVSRSKLYYYASVIGLGPVILLGMRTVGEIRLTDLLLLCLFQVLSCFYIHRRF